MKTYPQIFLGIALITGLLLIGCGDDHSSSPTAAVSVSGTGSIEGQLVADAGIQFAMLSVPLAQHAGEEPDSVYPLSGVTVELIQHATVIATTTTDEYGRFQFSNPTPGAYDVRVLSSDDSVAHYHVSVDSDQILTIYGRVVSGDWEWEHEPGPHWDEMPHGSHWGGGFHGASPGSGYWHDGHGWHAPGTGPHHDPHHGPHHA